MVQSVTAQSTPQVSLTEEDLRVRLARAYQNGDGEGVFEIWQLIADGKLSPESKELWLNTLAKWIVISNNPKQGEAPSAPNEAIVVAQPGSRADRVNIGLSLSGLSDPKIDGVEKDQWLLARLGTEQHPEGRRDASEVIWELIAKGWAGPFLRDVWLDRVAQDIWTAINGSKAEGSSKRSEQLLKALGLAGKKAANDRNTRIRLFALTVNAMGRKAYGCMFDREFATLIAQRLQRFGIISGDLDEKAIEEVKDLIRKETSKL